MKQVKMDMSSSGDESDEEELTRNFEEKTWSIIKTKSLPKKSAERY